MMSVRLSDLLVLENKQKALQLKFFETVWSSNRARVRITLISDGDRHHQDFMWPEEKDRIQQYVEDKQYNHDVYLNPVPLRMDTTTARETDVVGVHTLWADLDDAMREDAPADVEELGGFLVESGTPDHYHAYFPLKEPIDPDTAKIYNTALKVRLGGDPKQSAASLLRVPFTINHKPHNADGGWVDLDLDADLTPVGMLKLERWLELDKVSLEEIPDLELTPVEPPFIPDSLQRAIDLDNPDRSSKIHAVTLAAVESGLTIHETAYVILELPEARTKFRTDARILEDVNRTLKKKQITDLANSRSGNKHELAFFDGHIDLTPVDYLIEDFLPASAISVVAGQSGQGKSFVTIDMALSLATGIKWGDREVKKSRVIYMAMEGHNGFKSRVAAWVKHRGLQLDRSFASIPVNFSFKDEKNFTKLMNTVTEFGPDVIFVDTMVHAMTGWDENTVEDMQEFVSRVSQLQQRTGMAIVLVHHSSKNGMSGLRGSSSLRAGVESTFIVSKKGRQIKIATDKQKEGDDSAVEVFGLENVPFNLINSFGNKAQDPAVVVHARSATQEVLNREDKAESAAKEIYSTVKKRGVLPSTKTKLITTKMGKSGTLFSSFSGAFDELVIAGVLRPTEETKDRTRGKQFVLAEDHEVQWTRMAEADKVVLEGRDDQDDQEVE